MLNCHKKTISVLLVLSLSILLLTGCSNQIMNWDAYKLAKRVVELEQVQKRMDDRSNLRGKRMSKQEYENYYHEFNRYANKMLEKYSETPEQKQEFYNLVENKVNRIKNKQNHNKKNDTRQDINDFQLKQLFGLNSTSIDSLVRSKVTDSNPSTETNTSFIFEKSHTDQVINIDSMVYDAHPASVGIDWNAKERVPYPCDSLFASLGIYYDLEYGCWRLSEQARKEFERKKHEEYEEKPAIPMAAQPQQEQNKSKEGIVTQNDEETPAIEKPKNTKLKQEPKPAEEHKPTVNQKALFKGSKNPQAGGSEGITGQPGDQGKPNGVADIKQYDGKGGKGNGIGYDLGGRGCKNLPKPSQDFPEEGHIVVEIWIDREGQVIRAEISPKGTTIVNNDMRQSAIQAAKRSIFNADPDAPEEQHGTITYTFVINQ